MTEPNFDFAADDHEMPEATERAFRTHYDVELEPSGLVEQTVNEVERVYRHDEQAVVSVSGGKDSMALLALADHSEAPYRALHWDWGARLVPRELEREIVECIREYASGDQLLVAARSCAVFDVYDEHTAFRRQLHNSDDIDSPDGSLGKLAGVLRHADGVGTQLLGLRKGESLKRERKLEGEGLYGESLSLPAAFPLRNWSARDVWGYIIARGVPYPSHYDRVANTTGDGGVRAYEGARLSTFFDPEFENLTVDGVANWQYRDVLR